MDEMLTELQAWMWDTVAEPVLAELGFTSTPTGAPDGWPRLWWCPTGPLTMLPLHSAGYHKDPDEHGMFRRTVLDRVVSSYTPTLRALVEARAAGTDAQRRDGAAEDERLLLVTVEDVPGQMPLNSGVEREALIGVLPQDRLTQLEGAMATREAVQRHLPDHKWVHFSCHGDQDLLEPSRGGLLLHDAMLTIADIMSGSFHGDLVGLSACKTALGGVELLDEVITLAAALHYVGYLHVLAAVWSVPDDSAAQLFADVYRRITVEGRVRPEFSAAALHTAVRRLRARPGSWPHVWTPFIHIGP